MDKLIIYIKTITDNIYKNIEQLQERKRKCNIKNLFSTMIASSFGDNKECNFNFLYDSNKCISESTRSYWRSKIYDVSLCGNDYSDVYSYAYDNKIIQNNVVPDKHKHLYERFNILAGDLTKTKSAYRNSSHSGKNIASIGLSVLFDINAHMIRSYNITYDNNEITGLLKHNFSKDDVIILDRYYSSCDLFNKLKKRTNFIIRLKKNLTFVKDFMVTNDLSKIANVNGTRLKLVKYWIDKETRNIIYNKYSEDGELSDEEYSDCYILATNITDISDDDCMYLYKKRWSIEVAFKQLKQNFRIRYPCQTVRSLLPLKKCEFWYKMSFLMFNLTSVLKNCLDNENNIDCNFSECSR